MKTETFKAFGETLEIDFDGSVWSFGGQQFSSKRDAKKAAIEALITDSGDDVEDYDVDSMLAN